MWVNSLRPMLRMQCAPPAYPALPPPLSHDTHSETLVCDGNHRRDAGASRIRDGR